MKPFEGMLVLDFTQFTSGPVCAYILADLGAEVVKIENPPYGDNNHYNSPSKNKHTSYIASLNHNKKTVLMNMKDPQQQEIFFRMVEKADLVLDNFKAGTLEKFGVTFEKLQAANPRIVWTSISGYGQTGPWHTKTAYDVTIQAGSGLMSVTGEKGGSPLKAGISMSDFTAGLYACCGSIAALLDAKRTGKGRRLDVAMLDSSFSLVAQALARRSITGQTDPRMGREHLSYAPHNTYRCRDGKEIVLCVRTDEEFAALCKVLQLDADKDARFASVKARLAHRDEVNALVSSAVAAWDYDALYEALSDKLPCAGICNVEQAFHAPQIQARHMVVPLRFDDGTTTAIPALPIKMSNMEEAEETYCHELGQDTISFLSRFADAEQVHRIYDPIVADSAEKWAARTAKLQ